MLTRTTLAMNFLVFFLIIATAIAASIPFETSNVIHTLSLTNSLPVSAHDGENRSNLEQVALVVLLVASMKIYIVYVKLTIAAVLAMCAMNPTDCTIFFPDPSVDSLASIKNITFGDRQETNSFNASIKFPTASTVAKKAVVPNPQRSPFPFTVPAFWKPYVNVPLIAFHHELANSADPSTGSFIPYLKGITRISNPWSYTVAPHAKLLVPADTVSETTSQ